MMRVFALLLWMFAGAAQAGAPALAQDQVLRRGNGPEPETLDPGKADGVQTSNVLRDLYQGLTDEAPDGAIVPGVAQSWDISADKKTYTFHLRDDACWSNGAPVTAQDFVAGLRRSADPATGSDYSQILTPILNAEAVTAGKLPPSALGVEALDDHTLRIQLKGPTPYLLGLLTHATTYPVYRPALAKYGIRAFRPEHLVGNGAYKIVQWRVQAYVELVRNHFYWDDAHTTINRVYYYNTEDLSSEFDRYRAGELDWTDDIPVTQAKWIAKNIPGQWRKASYLGSYFYGFNLTRPPFKGNFKLRRALTLAIDRNVIVKKVLGTGEQPAYDWIPPVAHYRQQLPEWATWPRAQRIAEARRLYAEAGYSAAHPLQVQILYNTSQDHKKIATVIAAMWKQYLGAQVTMRNEEFRVFLQTRNRKLVTQVFRSAWIGDYDDAFSFADLLNSKNGNNDMGYNNPQYDALLQQASLEPDEDQREQILEHAERVMQADQPVIPLYFYETKRLVKPWVVGWQDNIMDHHSTKDMRILAH
ncbi:MAG: peptide ABC transporter substrate-binding protein [Stenotrophobium sp.]